MDDTTEVRGVVLGYFTTALAQRVAALETLLAGVTRTTHNGYATLRFNQVNLWLTNGTGITYSANGYGNLIVGYDVNGFGLLRTGSHHLVVGNNHGWTESGGVVFGLRNVINGNGATVTGGEGNTASGFRSSVSGGWNNTASGVRSSVSGGERNTASGLSSVVSGGYLNASTGELRPCPAVLTGPRRAKVTGAPAGCGRKTECARGAMHPECWAPRAGPGEGRRCRDRRSRGPR